MINDIQILKDVSEKLIDNDIPFMVTGSMAMNFYIEPRMTRDIDIVVLLKKENIPKIMEIFSAEYYIDDYSIEQAIKYNKMFNIVHNDTIVKIDFIIRKQSAYRVLEFERRKLVTIMDFQTYVVSIEDLILSKLEWMKSSQSEMQRKDILNLLSVDYEKDYLLKNGELLGLSNLLQELTNG